MKTVNVYLSFEGNCAEAFDFYKSVFGGEFSYIGKYKDMPPIPDFPPLSKEDGEKITHVCLPISKETMLMGSDNIACGGMELHFGNNFSISANVDTKAEADRLFTALSKGGAVTMPIADMFWGDYWGSFTDRFGVNWMVNCSGSKKG